MGQYIIMWILGQCWFDVFIWTFLTPGYMSVTSNALQKVIQIVPRKKKLRIVQHLNFFFYQGFLSRTLTTHRTAGEGRGPSFIPLYHFHLLTNIYLQLCTWDDYYIFLIATLVFTRLLLDEIYHLIELLFDWLMM